MSLLKKGKKVGKFAFVDMPLSLIGVNALKMGNKQIADLWKSLSYPVCPHCDKGVLQCQYDEQVLDQLTDGTTRQLSPWMCNNCGFAFLAENDLNAVRKSAVRYRNERVKCQLTEMELAEREGIAKGHRLQSRAFFISSMLSVVGFIYMLASGAAFLLALNWLSIAFALWVFAMKKSYRAWQVTTGQLFVAGAFWFWFKHEKWLV